MAGFFKKLFGGMSKGSSNDVETLVIETLEGLLERADLELSAETRFVANDDGNVLSIEFSGADKDLVIEHKGQMLDAFQLFIKRVVQHHFPEDKTNILVDCDGYRKKMEEALIERAESLKQIAIDEGKSVYYRALPPKERKVVHQYLAKDPRVESRSLGNGLYKKIKIFPAKNAALESQDDHSHES